MSAPVTLVAIDPGKAHAGVAVFCYGILSRAFRLAAADQEMFLRTVDRALLSEYVDEVVLELMVPRRGDRGSKAADLIDVATSGAWLAAKVCGDGSTHHLVRPSEWKGSVPKPARKSPYIVEARCRARLSADEIAAVQVPDNWRHAMDVWDAVGIGLHVLGRGILLPAVLITS